MIIVEFAALAVGFGLMVVASKSAVDVATELAVGSRISPLVIGLTLLATQMTLVLGLLPLVAMIGPAGLDGFRSRHRFVYKGFFLAGLDGFRSRHRFVR